jgi:phage head maturation protease
MELDYKAVPVTNVADVKDQGNGIITALVSVTGIKDNVGDIIHPGAFEKSLVTRRAKGVWHHDVTKSVSKTLDIKELKPGDSLLPKALPDGSPWPAEAGGLWVKMQFNLKSTRGKDAYEDVKFFADEQEWSIGFNVPTGGAEIDKKTGIRHIKTVNLYEYSPVLFGAMPNARTFVGADTEVKSAQGMWKKFGTLEDPVLKAMLEGVAGEQAVMETKGLFDDLEFKKRPVPPWMKEKNKENAKDGGDDDDSDKDGDDDADKSKSKKKTPPWVKDDEDDDDDKDKNRKSFLTNFSNVQLVDEAIDALSNLKTAMIEHTKDEDNTADDGGDDDEEDSTLGDLVSKAGLDVGSAVDDFETAIENDDAEAADTAATLILDAVSDAIADATETDDLREIASIISDDLDTLSDDNDSEGGDDDDKPKPKDDGHDEAPKPTGTEDEGKAGYLKFDRKDFAFADMLDS